MIRGQKSAKHTAALYPGRTKIANMDIKIPTDSVSPRPVSSQATDLLAKLKAAGTVEAEVIRQLQGKLLLSSRVGDILTSNTLNYKPGDRVSLRLDGSAQNPVLKVSSVPIKPINLDSRQHTDLARALPPDQPVLARVARIVAQQAEIQLYGQTLKLPRQVNTVKNQLLSLRLNESRRNIEVTLLERKAIYKAILKQLIPRQAENATSSLVKLISLGRQIMAETRPQPPSIIAPRSPTTGGHMTHAAQTASPRGDNGAVKPGSGTNTVRPQAGIAGNTNASRPDAKPGPSSVINSGIKTMDMAAAKSAESSPITRLAGHRSPTPERLTLDRSRSTSAGPISAGIRSTAPTTVADPNALQLLMQLAARLPEVDAAGIKRWFEFARLIKQSKTDMPASISLDALRMLKQLTDRENFTRELMQSIQNSARTTADADNATTRLNSQESLLLQIREGVKLAEQGLSQNLLQRASLGLQQETQQPVSFNMALPLIEQQQIKPLFIDLAQRNQAQEKADKSWDIRLSFEFADLGLISCHIVLEGMAVAASFYSEREQTRENIDTALPQLRQQLSAVGFTPGEFHSFQGRAAPKRESTATDFSESLIDIEV